jgi:hypothetical protein
MKSTRRGFLTTAVAAAATQPHLHAQKHEHDHQEVPSDPTLRVKALESLLVEKGLVDPAALDALVDTFENKVGPRNGARVVARAWTDPAYKARLLVDAPKAIAELGFSPGQGEHMVVVENTPKQHCTLGEALARGIVQYLACRQRVVAQHDAFAIAGDKRPSVPGLVIRECMFSQIRV